MGRPSVQQVMALAPDGQSLKAAKGLAVPEPWSDAACDDRAVWGACRGSSTTPYEVVCDLAGPAYRCTCPSYKFPCKHALGLLLLWASGSAAVPPGHPPPDAAAWLAGRAASGSIEAEVENRTIPGIPDEPEKAKKVVDPEAAAARVSQRAERITHGMAELDLWLGDLVRHGFGPAQSQPYAFWDTMAARMVDAQAPAAANRVRRLAGVAPSGDGWPTRMLAHVARLHLLAQGWSIYEELPEDTRADLRTAAGWPWPSEQVLAGPRETDRWYVLGRSITDEELVRAQRTWLWGLDSGRPAVIIDFARPGAAFAWELWPGRVLDADLARFPGSANLRVLVADKRESSEDEAGPPPGADDFATVATARGEAVARDPWLDRWPLSVRHVTPIRRAQAWRIIDRDGRELPLVADDTLGWRVLAASEGRAVHLFGEWEDGGVRPLTIWTHDRLVLL